MPAPVLRFRSRSWRCSSASSRRCWRSGPGPPDRSALTARAAGPEPGQEISRALTVTALDGTRSVETLITLQQSTSARVEDPMVTLEVVPSLVRVRDTTSGVARLVADNRGGTEWAHLRLQASDPERRGAGDLGLAAAACPTRLGPRRPRPGSRRRCRMPARR